MVINDLLGICGGVQLGELPEDSECGCLIAPPLSQICGVVILPNGAKSPLDWTNKSDIESTIDNTVNNNTRGKWLLGIGEIAEPQEIIAELGRTYIKYARRVYTLVHEVPICDQITYNFLLKLQTNWTGFNFWYYTVGCHFYGKSGGIRPAYVTVTFPKGRGEEDVEIGNVKITWYADGDPLRTHIDSLNQPDTPDGGGGNTNFLMYRQPFPAQSSASLIWTEDSGNVPTDDDVRLWVFQRGQKLEPIVQYTVTPNTGAGESTIAINTDTHFDGADYEVYTFPES